MVMPMRGSRLRLVLRETGEELCGNSVIASDAVHPLVA